MIIILIIAELHTARDNYYFYDKCLLQFYFILSAAVDTFFQSKFCFSNKQSEKYDSIPNTGNNT